MTEKEAAERFGDYANELAVIISKLNEMKEHLEYVHDEMRDNGDPYYDISEVIEKAGVLLSTITIYKQEYEADFEKKAE